MERMLIVVAPIADGTQPCGERTLGDDAHS
jgi:hypothetical protein